MNPTTQGQLDPKLKETYDRVMGSQFTVPAAPPKSPVMPSASIPPSPVQTQTPAQTVQAPLPSSGQAIPASAPAQVFVASPATPNGSKTTVVKNPSGKKISPVIFIILGIAFFAVYAVVWLKVFRIM